MTDAITFAKYVATRCAEKNRPISNLTLQHIIYNIYNEQKSREYPWFLIGEMPDKIVSELAEKRGRLESQITRKYNNKFEDRGVIGFVLPEVFNRFCAYGGMSIINTWDKEDIKKDYLLFLETEERVEKELEIVDTIIEHYRKDYWFSRGYDKDMDIIE